MLSVEPVNDWVELSRLAHAVVLMEHGRSSPGRAVVQVDDPAQERIRHRASKLLRKLGEAGHYAVLGVYPMQTVVPDVQRHQDADLFGLQPAIPLDLTCARQIVAATRATQHRSQHLQKDYDASLQVIHASSHDIALLSQ